MAKFQSPPSQSGEDSRHLVWRKTASREHHRQQHTGPVIDGDNSGEFARPRRRRESAHHVCERQQYVSISVPSATSVAASCTFTVRRCCEDSCPVVRVNTPGLLQQSHVWYCYGLMQRLQAIQYAAAYLITGARRRDHISPVLRQLHWLPVRQRVQFKLAVLVFKALHGHWASPVLDGRLSARCRCRSPSTTVI